MNDYDSDRAGSPPSPMDLQGRRRRAALLNGLAKGSALAAAALPMRGGASPMTSTTVDIPSGRHCSVSGFQSTAKSKASAEFCGAYIPGHFIKDQAAASKLPGDPGIIIGTRWISANNWSSPAKVLAQNTLTVAGMLDSLLPGTPLALQALYDLSNDGFFIAAYLSAALGPAPSGRVHVPFPPSYVVSQYNNGSPTPEAVAFFRALCVWS